ncbi:MULTISPECIES: DUF2232 domain-containing protein [unclassified Methylobacterium]|uniref:DUF2232 domain-containing protein n=1 Tax=unclassified Methylobacterium TaxID=2615210 RepID=UPI000348AF2E|nr:MULTISPECIES: DUF2232 domain-containing protein [unclassified Methylobacterium]MBN4096904.1 DUF2232 domain-containing protein [Methylobacterium sp. OT2]SEF76120.1 Predicted membrane protein [Methylobacterium sp. 190mf]SEH38707.1 Predicted membrane protein [Methylobacterium sp. 275MFSha3.1]SEM88219.1 Predicted membrane protein [Methylobacterium sp. UNC300MFChir4.1]
MAQHIGIGIGAGLVSALLFGVLLKATPLAILLYLVAPLPILIVGLGWSHKAALAAAAAGSLALVLVIAPFLGLAFAAYIALPAWWLAYLALLGRETPAGLEWYPTGRLLGWIAATAALAFIAIAVLSSPNHAAFDAQLRGLAQTLVQTRLPSARPSPETPRADAPRADAPSTGGEAGGKDGAATPGPAPQADADPADVTRAEVADALARVVPAFAANGLALLLAFYLWASARIVKISGRLPRPWPDIPSTAMPRSTLVAVAAAVGMCFAPGYVGVFGVALLGAFSAAFALQGLAAFHDRSRGRPGRGLMLFGMYLILFVTQGIALVALTLFGLADTALDRRRPKGDPAP